MRLSYGWTCMADGCDAGGAGPRADQRQTDVVLYGTCILATIGYLAQHDWLGAFWPACAAVFYLDAKSWRRLYVGSGKHSEDES